MAARRGSPAVSHMLGPKLHGSQGCFPAASLSYGSSFPGFAHPCTQPAVQPARKTSTWSVQRHDTPIAGSRALSLDHLRLQ